MQLLPYGGKLYVPGEVLSNQYQLVHERTSGGDVYVRRYVGRGASWYRIDPETFRVEVVSLDRNPPSPGCWYGVSNHYGLVGGCRAIGDMPPRFFRLVPAELGETKPQPETERPGLRESKLGRSGLVLVASSVTDTGEFVGGSPESQPAANGKTPDTVKPKTITADEFRQRRLEYGRRIYRDAYLKLGARDPKWDDAALALLDAAARYDAYRDVPQGWVYDMPSPEEINRLALAAHDKECSDPLVFSLYLGALAHPRLDHETSQTALRMLEEMRRRQYPPIHAAHLAYKIAALQPPPSLPAVRSAAPIVLKRSEILQKVLPLLSESLQAAACAEQCQDIDRRFVLQTLLSRFGAHFRRSSAACQCAGPPLRCQPVDRRHP